MPNLGKTLLIANPVAQNGHGASAAHHAGDRLRSVLTGGGFDLVMTEAPLHGMDLAAQSGDYDSVIALGGDGLIHEVVNGLMEIDTAERPALGVLPIGSGNDYARTLGMSFNIDRALEQVLRAEARPFDLGTCNGEYFVETLSFGLDAAIALDTVERRKRTGAKGASLFLASGIDMLLHQMAEHHYTVSIDEKDPIRGSMLMFAVQIGPTYGGGFKICPEAKTDDGLLDICIAHPPLGIPKAIFIFLLAKNAHHTGFKNLEFARARKLTICFDACPPTQIDGEPFPAQTYDITVAPAALQVLVP